MRERLEEYAPYITWFGLFVLVAGLLLPLLIPSSTAEQMPSWLPWALVVVGAVLALAWPVFRPGDVKAALGARQTRYGGNALILIISVIGALVVLNFLASMRYAIIDATSNRQYSISRQTKQILDELDDRDEKLKLTVVMRAVDTTTVQDIEQLIDKYKAYTGNLEYRLIDPEQDPLALVALAERMGEEPQSLTRVLVAEMGDEHELVYSGFDEQAITEAILKVMNPGSRQVMFTSGHGEYDPNGGERGYSSVRDQLEREGYEVQVANLKTLTETLSADTVDAVIVAGPQQSFMPEESDMLKGYMEEGGAVMLLLDSPLIGAKDTGLEELIEPWGLSRDDDVVLQQNVLGMLSTSVFAGGDSIKWHSITKDLSGAGVDIAFPGAASLTIGDAVTTTLQATELIGVDGAVWGETDFEALAEQKAEPDETTDYMPPLTLAVAAEDTSDEGALGRLVMIGSSGIVADQFLRSAGGVTANFDFFLNSVNWLAQEEELISIRPKEPDERPVEPPDARGSYMLLLTTVILLPLVVLSAGAWLYWQRR
jgi:ABC-type uncharacterized transport system involved in gliding motility auxiliary subunit